MMMIVIIVAVVVVVVKASRRTSKLATSLTIQLFHNCECLTLYNSGAHRRAIVCLPRASTFLLEMGKGASNNTLELKGGYWKYGNKGVGIGQASKPKRWPTIRSNYREHESRSEHPGMS